jgi:uncharacterized protein involved in outer membrane biogenesis
MRKLVIAAVVLVAIFVGGALLAAANLNSWLNENRAWVASEVQRVIGREVSFGEVDVSIWSGFGVRVSEVSIADDSAYSNDAFVSAGTVEVRVEILPALMGEFRVGRVVLLEPSIRVIQTARGLSIDSLGSSESADAPPSQTSAKAPGPDTEQGEAGASQALALTVSLIDVQGGTFVFVDQTAKPPVELALTQVDFTASDVSLTEPIGFSLRAAALGANKQNVEISGTVGPITAEQSDIEIDLELDVGPLSIENLMALSAAREALPPDMAASGALSIESQVAGRLGALTVAGAFDATDAAFMTGGDADGGFSKPIGKTLRFEWSAVREGDALNISKADLHLGDSQIHLEGRAENLSAVILATLTIRSDRVGLADFGVPAAEGAPEDEIRDLAVDARLSMPERGPRLGVELASPSGVVSGAAYDDLKFVFDLSDGRATIKDLTMKVFGGSMKVVGFYDQSGKVPNFKLETELESVSVAKLVESQAASMVGMVEGTAAANLSVRGRGSEWEDIREAMIGTGNLILEEGTLKDVNLADSVIKGITGVPGLSNLIDAEIRDKYPSVFGVGDTVFEKMDTKLDIRGGIAQVRDFRLAARDYTLTGEGEYALRNELDMHVAMTLSEALSGDLVASVKEARYLQNSAERIEIPVRLRGGIPDVRAEPDLGRVARALQTEVLGDLLGKALGSSKEDAEGESSESDGQKLLRQGLKGLFGGDSK